jgi:hypothetical protein
MTARTAITIKHQASILDGRRLGGDIMSNVGERLSLLV